MYEQIRQDVIVDLRDLSTEDRKRFLDKQLAILDARVQESKIDCETAKHRSEAVKAFAAYEQLNVESVKERLQNEKELAELNKKQQELQNIQSQEWLRPSHSHYPTVAYDEERKQFTATSDTIVAYGDTPEMACDNFDHLWVYGNEER